MIPKGKQICCKHIYKKERDILIVLNSGQCFQFLCGGDHGYDEEPELIDIDEIIYYDPSIISVFSLKENHEIERKSKNSLWALRYHDEE